MVNKRWKFCCTWPYVTAHPYSLYFVDVELPIPFQAAVLFTQYVVGVIYIETYNTIQLCCQVLRLIAEHKKCLMVPYVFTCTFHTNNHESYVQYIKPWACGALYYYNVLHTSFMVIYGKG